VAESSPPPSGAFDRDTAVQRERADGGETAYSAEVSPDWRAGRGPHGGYIAAMLLRALIDAVGDPRRAPRSLTVHYPRTPKPGPVSIRTTIEREGRSLSTLSARMEQDGKLIALVLAAFSVPWSAPELSDLKMPNVPGPDQTREAGTLEKLGAPPFTRHLVMQPRIGGRPFAASEQPMEIGGWLGLAEPRPIDALSLAFFSDALFPPPFVRLREQQRVVAPTIDLTVHFRTATPPTPKPDPDELCLARFRTRLAHEGFFDESGVIWAQDGTVLAQSRQLAILLPVR
jgi:acyl-CoA thioesterase